MSNEDTLRPEYSADLITSGVRGKYASRYKEGTNVVVIEPDLHKIFPDSEAVNRALRQYVKEHQISQAQIEVSKDTRQEVKRMPDIILKETKLYKVLKAEGDVILRQLRKRFGNLSEEVQTSISEPPLTVLEELREVLLDFSDISEAQDWLTNRSRQ